MESLSPPSPDKNEEYRTVSLMWNISDHVKSLSCQGALWEPLFNKLLTLALHSKHGETHQTCMHTATQVLAECSSLIAGPLLQTLASQYYLPLFLLLLAIDSPAELDVPTQAETMRMAIKNMLKIIRKLLKEQRANPNKILSDINQKLLSFLASNNKAVSLEYLNELTAYLEYYKAEATQ